MADRSALVGHNLSLFLIVSCLAAFGSSEYRFNGFRGSFVPNNLNKNVATARPPVQQQQHSNYFNNLNNNNNNNYKTLTTTTQNKVVDAHDNDVLVNNNNKREDGNGKCAQKSVRDFREVPGECSKFHMCSNGLLITFNCPDNTVFNVDLKACVPKGSRFDTCQEEQPNVPSVFVPVRPAQPVSQLTTLCPRGATYKKAHPVHCARYYDCGQPAMMTRWEDHEWECKYPFLFNVDTDRCEHYSMVSCGARKIAYDRCDYKQYGCNGHAHCRPCTVEHPSCKGLPNGMNVWQGRTPSPYYVVCSDNRVVYSGTCPSGQLFDAKTGTCVIHQTNLTW